MSEYCDNGADLYVGKCFLEGADDLGKIGETHRGVPDDLGFFARALFKRRSALRRAEIMDAL
jgi:hypothetical protein